MWSQENGNWEVIPQTIYPGYIAIQMTIKVWLWNAYTIWMASHWWYGSSCTCIYQGKMTSSMDGPRKICVDTFESCVLITAPYLLIISPSMEAFLLHQLIRMRFYYLILSGGVLIISPSLEALLLSTHSRRCSDNWLLSCSREKQTRQRWLQ